MRKSIALAIAAIGIGLTTNVFANAAGPQLSPSTINLSAAGVSNVLMHTTISNLEEFGCARDQFKIDIYQKEVILVLGHPVDELDVTTDSANHYLVTITNFTSTPGIKPGEVTVYASTTCNEGVENENRDTAKIVDNSGVE